MISSDGLGQLNLDYIDPVSSRKRITGAIFHVNHDPTQPKAITWNQNALSPSSSTSTSTSTATSAAAATSTPETAASITTVPSSLTSSYLQAANTISHPYTSTSTSTSLPVKSSSSSSAKTASITLGTVLGIVFATALFMFWIRKRRQKKRSAQNVGVSPATPLPVPRQTFAIHEKDAEVANTELEGQESRWELDSGKR